MWLPKALFFVVVTMRPARANKEKERMTRAINTSINVNPLHLMSGFKIRPPFVFERGSLQNLYQTDFRGKSEE
jgi:hypothetical protein